MKPLSQSQSQSRLQSFLSKSITNPLPISQILPSLPFTGVGRRETEDMAGNLTVRMRRERLTACMTCPICQKLFRDATTISECLHTFCKKCIYEKLSDEGLHCCPVCNTDLGCTPLEKLRPDHSLQDIRAKLFPARRQELIVAAVPQNEEPHHLNDPESQRVLYCEGHDRKRKAEEKMDGKPERIQKIHGKGERTVLDAATARGERTVPMWFSLVASDDQNGHESLRQIPTSYLRIKNGNNLTVSFIQKYLMKKLHLSSEDEVELRFLGESLLPTLELTSLVHMWLQCAPTSEELVLTTSVGASAEECLMVLTYSRHVSV